MKLGQKPIRRLNIIGVLNKGRAEIKRKGWLGQVREKKT